jgi:hypothetical protein
MGPRKGDEQGCHNGDAGDACPRAELIILGIPKIAAASSARCIASQRAKVTGAQPQSGKRAYRHNKSGKPTVMNTDGISYLPRHGYCDRIPTVGLGSYSTKISFKSKQTCIGSYGTASHH